MINDPATGLDRDVVAHGAPSTRPTRHADADTRDAVSHTQGVVAGGSSTCQDGADAVPSMNAQVDRVPVV
jgi:hypothetical protein